MPICSLLAETAHSVSFSLSRFSPRKRMRNLALIVGGACAAMLPDALQFAYMRFPHQPLTIIQRFHEWIHTSQRLRGRPVLGVASQFAFVIVFLIAMHPLLPN